MAEGERASRLGLAGIPREAETVMLDRDLRLVALTGARYHAAFVSNALSLEAMARARARRPRRHLRRLDQPSDAQRERRRRLPHVPEAQPAAARRRRAPGAGRGARRRADRRHRLRPRSAGRRDQAPAVRRGRGRARSASRPCCRRPAAGRRRADLAAAPAPGDVDAAGRDPRAAERTARVGAPADLIRFDPDEPYRARSRQAPFALPQHAVRRGAAGGRRQADAGCRQDRARIGLRGRSLACWNLARCRSPVASPISTRLALGYLCGSIPFGLLLTRFAGTGGFARHRLGQHRRDQRAAHRAARISPPRRCCSTR